MALLGNYYADTDQPDRASAMFTAAAEQGDDLAWLELGRHLDEAGAFEEAERCFLKALDLGEEEANWSFSLFLLGQDRPDEAKAAAAQAIRDGWTEAVVAYAQAEAQLGHRALAEAAFLDAVDEGCRDARIAYLQFLAVSCMVVDLQRHLEIWREEIDEDDVLLVREILDRSASEASCRAGRRG